MNWQEVARWPQLQRAGETAHGTAAISVDSLQNTSPFQKPTDPGSIGLAHEIANTSTGELREQVRLLSRYSDVFGMAGARRRRLAVLELGRRMVVPHEH